MSKALLISSNCFLRGENLDSGLGLLDPMMMALERVSFVKARCHEIVDADMVTALVF